MRPGPLHPCASTGLVTKVDNWLARPTPAAVPQLNLQTYMAGTAVAEAGVEHGADRLPSAGCLLSMAAWWMPYQQGGAFFASHPILGPDERLWWGIPVIQGIGHGHVKQPLQLLVTSFIQLPACKHVSRLRHCRRSPP